MPNATSPAVNVQEQADDHATSWFGIVERFNPITVSDDELEDRCALVIETIRQCREFAVNMPAEYRPVKELGDKIGHDSLKRSLSRLFKVGKSTSLGELKKGYRAYLKDSGKM